MDILAKQTLVGAKTGPTAISRAFTPLVRGITYPDSGHFFLTQVQKIDSADLGCGNGGQLQVQKKEIKHLSQQKQERDFVLFLQKRLESHLLVISLQEDHRVSF